MCQSRHVKLRDPIKASGSEHCEQCEEDQPFFSSIVTVSLAHFIRNLGQANVSSSFGARAVVETAFDCNVLTERASW